MDIPNKYFDRRSLWRLWLAWKFRLFQQHRHRRLTLECVDGMSMLVLPDVFNPTLFYSSQALVRQLDRACIRPGMAVLDMGTGSGIGAVVAARMGAQVVAVDISRAAVRCAKINALLNGVEESIETRWGNLFEPVRGEHFDLILFNPPFFRGKPAESWEYAWRSIDVLDRFATGLSEALNPSGCARLIVSSDTIGVDEAAARHGLQSRVVWERNMISERFTVLEWKPIPDEDLRS